MEAGQNSQDFSIAWAPEPTDSFLNPLGQVAAGAALLPPKPEPGQYFLALGLRLQELVRRTPDGFRLATATLSQAGLLNEYPEDLDDVPRALVMDNAPLRARLQAMRVPGEVPKSPQETPAAREQLQQDSLEAWLNAVTTLPVNSPDDR